MGDLRSRGLWARAGGVALVVIVLALVLFVRPGGDEEEPGTDPASGSTTSSSPGVAPDPPSEQEWCSGFVRLADAQARYAGTTDAAGAAALRDAADELLAMGVPASMPEAARGGLYTVVSGIYGSLGETLDPSAVPGAADGDQVAGSDAAFASYLTESCPA